jgi:RNAse (barnase) inhibitor barstar
MAAFDPNADTEKNLDWRILRDGGVSLYRSESYLSDDIAALEAAGYRLIRFNCSTWRTPAKMHDELEEALHFPAYYGRNFNALWDCLQDIEVTNAGGLLIVLDGFAGFANGSNHDAAKGLVDIFARASRYHALMGRRLITLIQSDDPNMRLDGLAAVDACWNRREWLSKARGG